MRRWLVPLGAALAVLVVMVALWLQRPGSPADDAASGADGGFAAGGGAPPYGGSEPGSPGDTEPGSPGDVGPGAPEPLPSDPDASPPDPGVPAGPDTIAVDSFYRYDARHLALNYTNGIPECYGAAGSPRVEQNGTRVVVTIPRTPPTGDPDTACIDIALVSSVPVTLDQPLGDRVVLDGARAGTPVEEAAAPNEPGQAS